MNICDEKISCKQWKAVPYMYWNLLQGLNDLTEASFAVWQEMYVTVYIHTV